MQRNSTNYTPTKESVLPCVHCHARKGYAPGGLCAACYRTPGLREQYETWKRADPESRTCPNCQAVFVVNGAGVRKSFCDRKCAKAFRDRQTHIPAADRFWAKVDKSGDCWTWTGGRGPGGYGQFSLTPQRPIKAHRYSYELAHGTIETGLMVCHRCDNPPCVRPDHLFLGTAKDNTQDCIRKGRFGDRHGPRPDMAGENSPNAKLTTEQAISILSLKGRVSAKELAAAHGVSVGLIHFIWNGRAWKHLPR